MNPLLMKRHRNFYSENAENTEEKAYAKTQFKEHFGVKNKLNRRKIL